MRAAFIDGFTHELGKPEGWDETANGECFSLPVRIERFGNTISATSAWRPSRDELAALLAGATIELRVTGGQPPVSLHVAGVNETLEPATPTRTEQRVLLMAKMLRLCAQQFAAYSNSHREKRTEEGDRKAETNERFMKLCLDTLDGNAPVIGQPSSYQQRIATWMQATFGPAITADGTERNHRFLEEGLELVQSLGCSAEDAHQLVDYVYGRPAGEPGQEVGGTMVTLAALCNAHGIDVEQEAEREHDRIWTKVEAIREKQKRKPKVGPLPGIYPERGDA